MILLYKLKRKNIYFYMKILSCDLALGHTRGGNHAEYDSRPISNNMSIINEIPLGF